MNDDFYRRDGVGRMNDNSINGELSSIEGIFLFSQLTSEVEEEMEHLKSL